VESIENPPINVASEITSKHPHFLDNVMGVVQYRIHHPLKVHLEKECLTLLLCLSSPID